MTTQVVRKISIRLQPDGFSYLNQFFPIHPGADFNRRMEEAMLEALEASDETDTDECICSVENLRFCLSPTDIEASTAELMYRTTLPSAEQEETLVELKDDVRGIRFTFGIDSQMYHFILRNLPNVEFTHPLFELYRQWADSEEAKSNCMVADASEKHLNLIVFANGNLVLANRFEVNDTESTIYHMMNCWTQSGLDVLDDKLYLQTEVADIRQEIGKYIKQCES